MSVEDAVSSSIDHYTCTDEDFNSYISSLYKAFISDMLELSGTGLLSSTALYTTLKPEDGYGENAVHEDLYLNEKKRYNVDIDFDVEQTVNDIDMGLVEITSFTGPKLELIKEEMHRREQPPLLQTYCNASRYTYYRKQKVIEYAEFVDNAAVPPSVFTS